MANTINADNGVSSGSAGLKSSSDGTGILALQTNGTTGITVDASQNVLIGGASAQTGAVLAVTGGIQGTIKSGTAVASTSGTSIDFTSIPSWVKRITVMFDLVSTNGTSNLLAQIGNGSIINTGYTSLSIYAGNSSNTGSATTTSGCLLTGTSSAATQAIGSIQLVLETANTWVLSGTLTQITLNAVSFSNGRIALGGALDRVRITTVNGTDIFDGGSINILYEG